MDYCTFNVKVAEMCGVNAAVILQHLQFWVKKNRAKGINLHDGKYWTYATQKQLSEIFPWVTERQVKSALNKLIENGLLEKSKFNQEKWDQTTWYTLTDEGMEIFSKSAKNVEIQHSTKMSNRIDKNVSSNRQNCLFEQTKMSNRTDKNVQSNRQKCPTNTIYIYKDNIYTDIETDKEADRDRRSRDTDPPTAADVVKLFNEICTSLPPVQNLTKEREKIIRSQLKQHSLEDFNDLFIKAERSDFLSGRKDALWQASFDWLLKTSNMVRVLEGNYDNRAAPTKVQQESMKLDQRLVAFACDDAQVDEEDTT